MSGPKDYTPPPRYSMQVFDGKLNRVFQLQARLKNLCSEIAGLRVSDSNLSIYFDCSSDLRKLQKQNDAALKLLVFDYKGTFGQDVYNHISSDIDSKISLLQKQVDACEAIRSDFSSRKKDYEAYRAYLCFRENSILSFEEFKHRVTEYLKTNLDAQAPDLFNEAEQRISEVQFEREAAAFGFGFNSSSNLPKQQVIDHVTEKEAAVNKVRAEISDKVLAKLKGTAGGLITIDPEQAPPASAADRDAIVTKIRTLIHRCDDLVCKKRYDNDLQKLTTSKSLTDVYFFKELHDTILDDENRRALRTKIGAMLADLNNITVHREVEEQKQGVIKLCVNLLRLSSVASAEVEAARQRIDEMLRNSDNQRQQDQIRQKERLFLKSQIVLCLENLGYEVMDDLEVIDFEKQDDLLLKINNQENYLNLKFKEDGSMRYVFRIPEDPKELTTDQKKLKLHEMKVTCEAFQSVLSDLSKMGLKVNLRSEKPIEYESLISVAASKQAKLKAKAKGLRRQQFRNKYLSLSG